MKKLICILLSLIIASSLAACSSRSADAENSTSSTTAATTQMVDENLLTVEFTAPASFFDEESPATDLLTQEQKDKGFKSAKVNEDGSVTYTMSKKAFKTFTEETKKAVEENLNSLSTDFPCVKSVEYNADFSNIKLNVNKAEYEDGLNFFAIYSAGLQGQMYQAYTGTPQDELNVVVTVVDENGNTIESATYPTTEE